MTDLKRVMSLDALCLPAPWSEGVWRTEMSSPIGLHLVAESEQRIVAHLGAKVVLDELHVTTIAVAPEHRRRGIGQRLIREAVTRAGGIGTVTLEVRSRNTAARAFYTELGFREDGLRPLYYGDDDAVVMTLRL